MRIRLKRCKLDIPKRFFLPNEESNTDRQSYTEPLAYLKTVLSQRTYGADENVLYTFPCSVLQIEHEIPGELIISDSVVTFVGNEGTTYANFNICTHSISEVWLRRYQHDDNAIEFFLETNASIFIILQSRNDREIVKMYFADKIVQW